MQWARDKEQATVDKGVKPICFFICFWPFRDSRCDRSVNAGCYKYPQDEGFERFVRSAKKARAGAIVSTARTIKNSYDRTYAFCRHYSLMRLMYLPPNIYRFAEDKGHRESLHPGRLQKLKHDVCKIQLTRARKCR